MCGNNDTRKYWLIADRPNKAKNVALFRPLSRFYGGPWPPCPPSSYTPDYDLCRVVEDSPEITDNYQYHIL